MQKLIKKLFDNLKYEPSYNKEFSKIYKFHKYWARKPWYIVEQYIKEYTREGETVLDPFLGSGTTGLESIINGRNFIGYDLNPIAILISRGTLQSEVNIKELENDFKEIEKLCKDKILNFYKVNDVCSYCGEHLHFKHILNGPKYKEAPEGKLYCSNCNKRGSNIQRKLTPEEIEKLRDFENIEIPYWYPNTPFPEKFYKDRFSYKGISNVSQMFTKRNLYCSSLLLETIKKIRSKYEDLLLLAFTNTILHVSKLKGENVRPLSVNNYWIPDDYIEENVWFRFQDRFKNLINGKKALQKRIQGKDNIGEFVLNNKSSLKLDLQEKQIDYVFTDPPYGDTIQYSELSFVWNAWINKSYDNKEEVIINPVQKKGSTEFNNLLKQSLREIKRVLKKDGYFTLCFQNKDYKIWEEVIESCKELDLSLENINIYDTFGSPYNKHWSKFSPKADIYVTFKNSPPKNHNYFNKPTNLQTIIESVIEFMENNSIEIDTIKLYDITVGLLIWNLFYNLSKMNIDKFNSKIFCSIVDQYMGAKNKSVNEYYVQI